MVFVFIGGMYIPINVLDSAYPNEGESYANGLAVSKQPHSCSR